MSGFRHLLLATTALALAGSAVPAGAEEGAAANAETESEARRSDIVVKGLREGEGLNEEAASGALGAKKLLDTPFSITVVDAEDIAKRQATTIGQIFINDPSVFSFAIGATTNWWGTQIRGLGVRNYYIDDVQLMLNWGGDYPLESIESVEALKGLSGFMYGFGAPGGTVSYRTKRPTAEPLFSTEAGYRTDSVFYGRVDAGGPLSGDGKLGYRVNLAGEKGTAYNDAGVNRWLGSLALEYAFSPDLKWYATGTYEDSNLKREPFHIYWDSYGEETLPKVTYDYDKVNIDNSFYGTRTLALATGLDWKFAQGWSAKLTHGYNSKRHHANKMFVNMLDAAGDYQGNSYNFGWLDKTFFTQAMIQGEFETGPVRHAVVAGAVSQTTRSRRSTQFEWIADFSGNIYENQDFLVTRPISFALADGHDEETQRSLFLSDTVHVGDHVQLVAGARYTRYKSTVNGSPDDTYKVNALTPTFAIVVKPAAHASIYGSYVESLEPGSRVGGEFINFGDVLKATVSKQYELGFKYDLWGVSLTAAAFRIERANTSERIADGDVNGDGDVPDRYLTQDGLAVYQGLEANLSYRVNRDLRLGLGAIHLDPKLKKLAPNDDGTPSELIGNIPMEASKWQIVGNADYSISSVPGLTLHGNVRYFGKAPVSDFNVLFMPARTIVYAGFQYETQVGGRKVVFTGNVNNLFNQKHWGLQNFGEGRNASLSAKVYW